MTYAAFLETKAPLCPPSGMAKVPKLPKALKPFQADLVSWALRRGRAAIFAATGLGKTLQQLSWADAISNQEDAPILILTPLAVAQQTVREAVKFDIPGVSYAADKTQISSRLVITNYDRLEKFDPSAFAGVVLDESSIIKSHDSKTRLALIEAFAKTPWKLACTATPSPNDYVELGNHSEFLGVMSDKEMLSMFFVHDGSVRAGAGSDWRLKRHAEKDFWLWLSSWAAMIRSPKDLGYDEPGYDLPPLIRHQITVDRPQAPEGQLFHPIAQTMSERIGARRETMTERVQAAAKIVNAQPNEPWLIWCNLNTEAEALVKLIPSARQVQGSDTREYKEKNLLGFVVGDPPKMVTKPSIAGHGMNWQHCANMVFVGLNDSFEQLFQATRRCWRYGQTRPVNVYLIASELEGAVVANVARKEAEFEKMGEEMAVHMLGLVRQNVRGGRHSTVTHHAKQKMELPSWL